MALTAAIRTLLITLIGLGVSWLVDRLGLTDLIDVQQVAEIAANAAIVFGSGLVAYGVNKLGSRWGWINTILSLGRSATSAVYVPKDAKAVEVAVTPPGEQTTVIAETATGGRHLVKV